MSLMNALRLWMVRLTIVVLGLGAGVLLGDEQPKEPGPPPLDDLGAILLCLQVVSLEAKMLEHWEAGQFEQALQKAEQALPGWARILGKDAWQVVDARWRIEAFRRA